MVSRAGAAARADLGKNKGMTMYGHEKAQEASAGKVKAQRDAWRDKVRAEYGTAWPPSGQAVQH